MTVNRHGLIEAFLFTLIVPCHFMT